MQRMTNERRVSLQPTDVGVYTPGITRIEQRILCDLEGHDQMFVGLDKSEWMADYSLKEHSMNELRAMRAVSRALGRKQTVVDLAGVAGLGHDLGKLRTTDYRRNRKLTQDELVVVNKHPEFSGHYILEMMPRVRRRDRPFLAHLFFPVRFHHEPFKIRKKWLRELGFDLKFIDYYQSRMESRHKPGLSQFQAIEKLEKEVEKLKGLPSYSPFAEEMQTSLSAIVNLYGVNSLIPIR
ncbi:HD domain-containing protein [Candidatus Parcubacteria bacterium]|nr:HD domain-containing protein [Candidatus Parcubacteria bacterium]